MMRREEGSRDRGSNCARAVQLLGGALRDTGNEVGSSPAAHKDLPGCPRQGQAAAPLWPWSPFLLYKMRPPVPPAPLALLLLGCFSLLLWLWALCTACHRKRAQRQQTGLQGSLIPVEMSLLRQTRSLSKSDTRLHELRQGTRSSIAPRPASMDLLHPHWLEASRGSTRSQVTPSAFPPRQLPRAPPAAPATAPSTSPEATYSNVGLAAIPRASLAASPVVWAGTRLTISCAKLGPVAEYACIQKRKETEQGCQESKMIPVPQVDLLYSRVCKPKRRDPRPVTDQPDPRGGRAIVALGSDVEYEAIALRGQDTNQDPLENVYESIREMGP